MSKRIKLVVLLGSVCFLSGATVSVTSDVQATNYPLDCNGIYGLQVWYSDSTTVQASINHASSGYDSGLEPALTCAWHDRGMRSTEASCIRFTTGSDAPWFQLTHADDFNIGNQLYDYSPAYVDIECGGSQNTPVCAMAQGYWYSRRVRFMIGTPPNNNNGCLYPVSATLE